MNAYAEEIFTQHFTVDDGLPSSEAYDVIQDKKGYIWFATNRGVSRYNGQSFTKFTTVDGLIDNVVFQFYEDVSGRIWFLSYTGKLCFYYESKIYRYPYNELWKDDYTAIIRTFECDKKGNIIFSAHSKGWYVVNSEGKIQNRPQTKEIPVYSILMSETSFHGAYLAPKNLLPRDTILFETKLSDTVLSRKLGLEYIGYITHKTLLEKKVLISFSKKMLVQDMLTGEITEMGTPKVVRINQTSDSAIWISYWDGGVRRFDSFADFLENKYQEFMPDKIISGVLLDHEGGLWFTTLSEGVYYAPSLQVKQIHLPDPGKIKSLASNDTTVYCGLETGILFSINKDRTVRNLAFKANSNQLKSAINDLETFDSSLFILTERKLTATQNEIEHTGFYNSPMHRFCQNDSAYAVIGRHFIEIIPKDSKRATTRIRISNICTSVTYFQDKLMIGTIDGLIQKDGDTVAKTASHIEILQSRISDMLNLDDRFLLITTLGNGLIIYNGSGLINLNAQNSLCPNSINCIYRKNDEIWLGTNEGLVRIDISDSSTPKFEQFQKPDGLPTEEIHFITSSGNEVWAANKSILFSFYPASLKNNNSAPPIYLESISSAGRKLDITQGYLRFTEDDFPVKIEYSGLSYKNRSRILYQYRIRGNTETTWNSTGSSFVEFYSLPYGNYTFEVRAFNENEVPSTWPATIKFSVIPPFYQTIEFYFIASILVIILIITIFLIRIGNIRRKNKLRESILKLRQQALTGQINPHFLHNALNSVQAFIMTDDKRAASSYLSKFAKLMRRSLNHSEKELVNLEDELELIQNYVELEQLRFKSSFHVKIYMDDTIDSTNTLVPSMIIQPFVENAILHNIHYAQNMPLSIRIYFWFKGDNLLVRIIDNGSGISILGNKAKENESDRPSGTSISRERLKTAAIRYKKDFYFEIVDLQEKNPARNGTTVSFFLPYTLRNP